MTNWTIEHNSVELWPGPGFFPYLFPRCIRNPWGLQTAGICHDAGPWGWEEDPTNLVFFQIELQEVRTHSLSLGLLLCNLSWAPLAQWKALRPPVGWCSHPLDVCPDPLPRPFHWVGHCAVCGWILHGCRPGRWGSARPGCGSLGSHRALLVTLPLWHGLLGPYWRTCGCGGRQTLSITSIIGGTFRPFEEASQVGWYLQWIAQIILAWLLGENATVDSCREHECLTVCIRAVPGWVRLTPFPGLSCWCSCSWGQLEEQCSSLSLSWEHGGIGKGKTHLDGVLEGVLECTSLCVGPLCGRLWHHCCCLPLLHECLCMWWEHLINEPSHGCLMLVPSEQAEGMTILMDTLKGWSSLSILWLCSCLSSVQVGVHPSTLLGASRCFWLCEGLWTELSWDAQCCIHSARAMESSHLLVCDGGDPAWNEEGVHGGAGEHALPPRWGPAWVCSALSASLSNLCSAPKASPH